MASLIASSVIPKLSHFSVLVQARSENHHILNAQPARHDQYGRVSALGQAGCLILIEAETEPTLDAMLAAFDAKRHSGEVMAFAPVGVEVL